MLEKIGLPAKPSLRGNNWVVDASHCQGCSSQFTFINRKHHCRRCGGLFCNSCTQQRLYLRGQGDSPVRICDPCKKLEEATRFEMRHGHKNRAGKGGSRVASKNEDEVLNQILGNDSKDLVSTGQETSDMLLSLQRASTSTSSSNVKEVAPKIEGEEIHRSFSTNVHNSRITDTESASPEELRQQAVEEKKKYKILKAEGKPDEALRAFKWGKELERQAGALELELRKNRRKAMSSITMHEITVSKDESGRKSTFPEISKKKDDLSSELQELGWSENDLHDADKKPVNMTLEGELSSLIREVSQKTNDTEKVTQGIDKSGVIALKKRALALKREGKLGEAKEELKKAKLLEKQIEEQEFLVDAEDSDDELSSLIRSMDNDKQDDLFMKNDRDLDLNFSHLLNVDDGIGLDGNFEVTDDDMYDPDIAAALQSLGWSEDTSQHDETFSQIAPVDREGMLSEIQSLKREAVNKKRGGNTAEAMSLLKKAKALEADFATHNSDYGDLTTQNTTADTQRGLISQPVESSLKPDMGNKTVPKKSKLVIQRELLALKKKALALRREGKSDEAEEELKKGKALEQQLEEIENASNSKMKAPQENVGKKQTDITVSVDVEDEEGDVTDQDMNDPSYLSLLQNLGWKEEESEKFHSPPKDQYSYSTHTVQVPAVVQKGGSRRSKGEIQRELLGLKRKSLALRRQGEVDEAEEVLRNASVLESQLAEMEAPKQEVPVELENQKVDSFVKNLVDENVGVQVEEKIPLIVIQEIPARSSETKEEIIQPMREEIIDMSEIPQLSVQQEILAHKRKAISLKREGRMAEAKEELRQAKLLEKNTEDKKTEPSASTSTSSSIVSSSNVALDPIEKKEHNFSSPPKLSSRDRFKMQQESLGHKRKALKLRREGRLQEAEAEFELAKALETQLEELNANDSTKSATEHTEDAGVEDLLDPQLLSALREIGIESSGIESSRTQAPVPERTKPVKQQVADIPENANEERIQLEERIKAEKVKAVNLKRAGKQGEALDALRRAKLLQKKLASLAS